MASSFDPVSMFLVGAQPIASVIRPIETATVLNGLTFMVFLRKLGVPVGFDPTE